VPQILDPLIWAQQQFGACRLGHKRRTERVVKVAAMVARNSAASTPQQSDNWADLKAAYRFYDNDNVSFQQLIGPHRQLSREQCRGTVLVVSDTTEFDFKRPRIEGLKPTGNGSGVGFFLHSALFVRRDDGEVIGIAAQQIFYRQPKIKGETRTESLQRERESGIWGRVVEDVGAAPDGVKYLHICDRGADDFEFFCRLQQSGDGWVVRVAKGHRKVDTIGTDATRLGLQALVTQLPAMCQHQLSVPSKPGQAARTATLELRATRVRVPRPRQCSPWVK
jgi:hypothetical protein